MTGPVGAAGSQNLRERPSMSGGKGRISSERNWLDWFREESGGRRLEQLRARLAFGFGRQNPGGLCAVVPAREAEGRIVELVLAGIGA